MSLEQCYEYAGGDLKAAHTRLNDDLLKKFLPRLLTDGQNTYDSLVKAIDDEDILEARRHAHSMKGNARDFGFPALFEVSQRMQEFFQDDKGEPAATVDFEQAKILLVDVSNAFDKVKEAIALLDA